MARQEGEVTPPVAAEMLKLDERTVRRWAEDAVEGRTSRFRAAEVRKDLVGRYYIRRSEIRRIVLGEGATG